MKEKNRLRTPADFWREIVVPDFEEYRANLDDLRHALHTAISLFHVHDWVFTENKSRLCEKYLINPKDRGGASKFADALERESTEFVVIRSRPSILA
jgi:hypothetical protein